VFEKKFSHYLSYGPADQHTVRELRDSFDGLLVPGTVAAFQLEGTGGFVLALSATEAHTPYVIDPRSPLFQQDIEEPKRAHEALKAILGLPENYSPNPRKWNASLVEKVAENWVNFNCSYKTQTSAKFDKYAKRLGDVKHEAATEPKLLLAPYFASDSESDPWWEISLRLFEATRAKLAEQRGNRTCMRVVAAKSVSALVTLLPTLQDDKQMVIWVSSLDEFKTDAAELASYGTAVREGTANGKELFALYGGFFAVLLSGAGLRGASHGIGYGEYRNWKELPQSGPPPARYYLPELHKYVRAELADVLWGAQVTRCPCPACGNNPPILLDYHELMMHSVHCRAREIKEWTALSPSDAASRLDSELDAFGKRLKKAKIQQEPFKRETERHMTHIPVWIRALSQL